MSRYTGPSWRLSRRLGVSLSGTGKELARRAYAPGAVSYTHLTLPTN